MMNPIKETVIDLIKSLPDDCTCEDIQYHLYVREKVEKGLKEVEEGRFIPHAEAKARFQSRKP